MSDEDMTILRENFEILVEEIRRIIEPIVEAFSIILSEIIEWHENIYSELMLAKNDKHQTQMFIEADTSKLKERYMDHYDKKEKPTNNPVSKR